MPSSKGGRRSDVRKSEKLSWSVRWTAMPTQWNSAPARRRVPRRPRRGAISRSRLGGGGRLGLLGQGGVGEHELAVDVVALVARRLAPLPRAVLAQLPRVGVVGQAALECVEQVGAQ